MGSLKSGLFAIALTSLVGTAAVVGCSADGGSGITDTTTEPTEPAPDDGVGKLPPSSSSGNNVVPDAGKDASKKDSGPKPEAGVDAGPPPPVEGTACTTLNVTATKACGKCGKSATVCLDDGTGTNKGTWSPYGACGGEAGDCVPGESLTEDCGNCGKQVKTCTQYCAFTTGACTGQPANNCKPTTTEYSTAGCVTAQTYRNRTCGAACTWGNFSATCEAPVNELKLDIGTTVAAVTSKTITFSAVRQGPRMTGSCPSATVSASTKYPYQYVEVHNPTAKAAKVSVYASVAPGGQIVDTLMAVYGTSIQPMDDASRKACRDGVNDQSADTTLTGDSNFSLIKAVAIPAGGSVLVYLGAYVEVGALDFDGLPGVGDLNINTKVETLL
ncbi:MAG TPA: hypothetical protein VLT33_06380 [Labilithrix sp.]|nr:hypothetical protein [Labilithrix sp.]